MRRNVNRNQACKQAQHINKQKPDKQSKYYINNLRLLSLIFKHVSKNVKIKKRKLREPSIIIKTLEQICIVKNKKWTETETETNWNI